MFTGIVQGLGKIIDQSDSLYTIKTDLDLNDCKIGSSIACNGVCLTLTNIKKNKISYFFSVNIGEETNKRSVFGMKKQNNDFINLEKSLKFGDEISGHFVYGHIDCITKIKKINTLQNSWEFEFEKNFNENNLLLVEKGSISINGISLTISSISKDSFVVSIIPHTFNNTNLKFANENDFVNIEFDYLTRYNLNKNE